MLTREERIIVSALHWYFGVLLSKPKIDNDIKHSTMLGSLIAQLNGYSELMYVCALANGETGLTKEKEHEYVGRGFVDPFYRLTHSNDDCFYYAYNFLGEKDKNDFTGIQRIRSLGCDKQGMEALGILVMMIMTQQLEKLGFESMIPPDLAKTFGKKRYIADLTREQRISLVSFSPEQLNDLYDSLGELLEVGNQEQNTQEQSLNENDLNLDISMMILGGFIAAAGIAAVALAFTVLNAATMGIVLAAAGSVAILSGIGFFAKSAYNCLSSTNESLSCSLTP
ncbi:hypothetical protein [Legionella fallonii]|uniref:Uncharacterized protein n=1 Tax=Legionella fallonii LLAP-10 TaxID=1212491 RepID=A0A098G0G1_9GAMM|nr:hypothetical protein [Legionella fallonii]CEG55953.1 protein of unknown function [Legionella fallonii LLAP-10]